MTEPSGDLEAAALPRLHSLFTSHLLLSPPRAPLLPSLSPPPSSPDIHFCQAERLQLLDARPSTPAELLLVVEKCAKRFPGDQVRRRLLRHLGVILFVCAR